jgi:type II secretory pathway pseudopilin PulG
MVELMVVAAVVGIVAAAAGLGISNMLHSSRVRDENAAVTSALTTLRSNTIRTGQAGAISVDNGGTRINFGVIAPADCAAFRGNPAGTARDLTVLDLIATTVSITQPSGAVASACFSAQGFVPTTVDGAVAATTLNVVDVDVASATPLLAPTVAEIGTIGVVGEPPREGVAASGLRAVAFVDASAPAAVEPTPSPPPFSEAPPVAPPAPPPPLPLLPENATEPMPPATTPAPPAIPFVDVPPPGPPAPELPPPVGGGEGGAGGGGGGGGCFVAGTPVLTESGFVPIEQLSVGDVIWAANEDTAAFGFHPITEVFVHTDRTVWALHVVGEGSAEVIETTDVHPWFVDGAGWRSTAALQVGQSLVAASGERFVVEAAFPTARRATVFNLEVESAHTYFVGASSLWVHNGGTNNNVQLK